jgi:hypothetical protein
MLSDAERHKLDRAIADVADIIAVHRISDLDCRALYALTEAQRMLRMGENYLESTIGYRS